MEVKIGVQHAPRELSIDTELDGDQVQSALDTAVREGGVLSLTDSKGRRIVVPAANIAYVEIAQGVAGTVGFR
ncbi:DUF3107 domain-containing protein [Alteromonas gracilis]